MQEARLLLKTECRPGLNSMHTAEGFRAETQEASPRQETDERGRKPSEKISFLLMFSSQEELKDTLLVSLEIVPDMNSFFTCKVSCLRKRKPAD